MDKKQASFVLLQALVQGKGDMNDQEVERAVETAIALAEKLHAEFKDDD